MISRRGRPYTRWQPKGPARFAHGILISRSQARVTVPGSTLLLPIIREEGVAPPTDRCLPRLVITRAPSLYIYRPGSARFTPSPMGFIHPVISVSDVHSLVFGGQVITGGC